MNTRLLGAAVLVALAILFVPMMFSSKPPSTTSGDQSVSLAIPPAPDRDLQTKTMNLSGQAAAAGSTTPAPASTAANVEGMTPVQAAAASTAPPAPTPAAPPQPTPQPPQPIIPAMPPKHVATATHPTAPPSAPTVAPVIPDTPPATAARGIYAVNLSAYAADGANRLMQKVRAMGYPVRGQTIQRAGKTLTLVSAGPFETRAQAEAARLRISQGIPSVPARLESGATTPQGDEPAPAAGAPARAGAWAVQVAAMGSQTEAVALRDKLRASGFDGFVDTVNAGGRQLWRVRAGPQTQRSDAVSLRDQIKAKLGLDGNVVSAH
ncbi:SPOR domain-containing protein [Dyella choica]|uniref:SPOR domain-containing protein n=1 Tax=Dyella choica TaxID=1927959 RepID=A0A432M240_9GAMM|nr:SPOR domain-containing protein [Dyella choica]RUL72196.1 SPOR domain-containing protein [Dyella choica]